MEDRSIEVYKELAEQERIHRRAIENTMEYLEHPVDWFARIYEGGP